jgi:hypothetical protein
MTTKSEHDRITSLEVMTESDAREVLHDPSLYHSSVVKLAVKTLNPFTVNNSNNGRTYHAAKP